MGSQTPVTALPYPVGTDRVMDGDNAMQALAERIEARYPRGLVARQGKDSNVAAIGNVAVPVISLSASLYTGRSYRAFWNNGVVQMLTANNRVIMTIMVGSVVIAQGEEDIGVGGFAGPVSMAATFSVTTTGTHTLQATVLCFAGSTATYHATGRGAELSVEDVGPALA